jgi:hypothetical protein
VHDYKTVYRFISIYEKNGVYIDASQYMATGQVMVASMCTKRMNSYRHLFYMSTEQDIGAS